MCARFTRFHRYHPTLRPMCAVFLHVISRTPIITDLAFNIHDVGFWDRMLLSISEAHGTFGPSRLLNSDGLQHPDELRRALDVILAQDLRRVIPAHGNVVESDGREGLQEASPCLQLISASVAGAHPLETVVP